MNTLYANLNHDDGRTETVDTTFVGDWRNAFEHLVNVHCRTNTVELVPDRIDLAPGLTDAVWDGFDMIFVD